jgi:hypothetical protein
LRFTLKAMSRNGEFPEIELGTSNSGSSHESRSGNECQAKLMAAALDQSFYLHQWLFI